MKKFLLPAIVALSSCGLDDVIPGDDHKPTPPNHPYTPACNEVSIQNPGCRFIDSKSLEISFVLNQHIDPAVCNPALPIDLELYLQGTNINDWYIVGTHPFKPQVAFSKSQRYAGDVDNLSGYTFKGTIVYTNPVTANTSPSSEITANIYDDTHTRVSHDDYQFDCIYLSTPPNNPCVPKLLGMCHDVDVNNSRNATSIYRFNICEPSTLQVCFTTRGGQELHEEPGSTPTAIIYSEIRYVVVHANGTMTTLYRNPLAPAELLLSPGDIVKVMYTTKSPIVSGSTILHILNATPALQQTSPNPETFYGDNDCSR